MSQSDSCSSRKVELLKFPKPALSRLVTGTQEQVKWLWIITVCFAAFCGAVYFLHEFVAFFLAVVFLPSLALVSLIFQIWIFAQRGKLKSLESGHYYVCWAIAPEDWEQICAQRKAVNSSIPILFTQWFGGATLFFVTLSYFLGEGIFFDSAILHFVIPTLSVSVMSYLGGLLVILFSGMTDRIMQRDPALVVIGPNGIYMTGMFWPTSTAGQELISTKAVEEDSLLVCQFRVAQRHGSQSPVVSYPFPPNQIETARCVAELLNDPPHQIDLE